MLKVPPVVPIDLLHNEREIEQQKENNKSKTDGSGFDKIFDSELEPYGNPDDIKRSYLQNKKNR